jgi:hypothetical protein
MTWFASLSSEDQVIFLLHLAGFALMLDPEGIAYYIEQRHIDDLVMPYYTAFSQAETQQEQCMHLRAIMRRLNTMLRTATSVWHVKHV